mgnify:FL=1
MVSFYVDVLRHVFESEDFETVYSVARPLLLDMHAMLTRGLAGKLCASPEASTSLKMLQFFVQNELLAKVRQLPIRYLPLTGWVLVICYTLSVCHSQYLRCC